MYIREAYIEHLFFQMFCLSVAYKPSRTSPAANLSTERAMVPMVQGLIAQQLRWQELTRTSNHSQLRESDHRQVHHESQNSDDGRTVETSDRSSEEEEEVDVIMLRLPRASLFPKEAEEVPRSVPKPRKWPLLYPDDPPNYSELLVGQRDGPNREELPQSPVRTRIVCA